MWTHINLRVIKKPLRVAYDFIRLCLGMTHKEKLKELRKKHEARCKAFDVFWEAYHAYYDIVKAGGTVREGDPVEVRLREAHEIKDKKDREFDEAALALGFNLKEMRRGKR